MVVRLSLTDSEITRNTTGIIKLADSIVSRIIDEHASVGYIVPSADVDDESTLYLRGASPVYESVMFMDGCHLALIGRLKTMAGLGDLKAPQQAVMKKQFSSEWRGYEIRIATCPSIIGGDDRLQIAIITVSRKQSRPPRN